MGIEPPNPGQPITAAHDLAYDADHGAFVGSNGPLWLIPSGDYPFSWILTSARERTFSQATYDVLRAADPPNSHNLFVSGGHRYGLFDNGSEATADPA